MSAAWMAGYTSDVAYTLGFYRELAPAFLNYVCVTNGVEGLKDGKRLRYCELGCGRGYGTTLLAAANPDIEFVGIDFNPTHIAEARALASECGIANIRFVETSFADAAASKDPELGEFDIVALHGVYIWVEPRVRRDIVDFIRGKLVPGGISYVSYNTRPGWSVIEPIQHLLKEYGDRNTGDSLARLQNARTALLALAKSSAGYVTQNPAVKARIEAIGAQDLNYLAHEFFHEHWTPIYVTDAFRDFAEAKLTYVGSANVTENRLTFSVPQDMMALVSAAPDMPLREQLKDYAINKQFRRDVYVKGPMRLTGPQLRQKWSRLVFYRATVLRELPEVWRIPAGEARLKPELVQAVLATMEAGSATGAAILDSVKAANFSEDDALSVLEILVASGQVLPGRPDQASISQDASRRLNNAVLEKALADDTHRFLAAPTLGSAIGSNYLERVVLPLIMEDERAEATTIMDRAFTLMERHDRRMFRDGKPITRDNMDEMATLVAEIQAQAVPLWRRFGILG